MTVDIAIDLKAQKAMRKLDALHARLATLNLLSDDLDLGEFEFDFDSGDLGKSIQGMVDSLEDMEDTISGMGDSFKDAMRDLDFDVSIDANIKDGPQRVSAPTVFSDEGGIGATSDGGKSDGGGKSGATRRPPVQRIASRITEKYGLPDGALDLDSLRGMDRDDINNELARFKFRDHANLGKYFNPNRANLADDEKFGPNWRFTQDDSQAWGGSSLSQVMGKVSDVNTGRRTRGSFLSRMNIPNKMNRGLNAFEESLKGMMPTMKKWWQLLALLIPLFIAAGVQALGVAAALGSVAVAGGAIIGLGLLGHAQDMGAAFEQAKLQVSQLKTELFETFQPAMQSFAGIQAGFFDYIPDQLTTVALKMRELTTYEDTLYNLFDAGVGGVEKFIDILVQNEEIISQLATRFAGLIGAGLLEFFEWLIQSASRNQDMLIKLGEALIKIGVVIYNLSMAVSHVVVAFLPLLNVLVFISELLNSDLVIGLITVVSTLYIMAKVGYTLYTIYRLVYTAIALAIWVTNGFTVSLWGAVAAATALVGLLSILTLGGLAVGAMVTGAIGHSQIKGMPGGNGPKFSGGGSTRGGGGATVVNNNYEMTNYGEMNTADRQGFFTQFQRADSQMSAQQPPAPPTTASSSQTDKKGKGN